MAKTIESIAHPTQLKNRIVSLDILRGFALLGIGLVNIFGFNASFFDFGGFYSQLPEPVQLKFYTVFISLTADKFIFIFSFLFGYGFFLQLKKSSTLNNKFKSLYTRRIVGLAFFGLVHILVLWAGDILLLYAIAATVLFLLRKLPDFGLLAVGIFFYLFISFWLLADHFLPLPDALTSTCTSCLDQARDMYTNGSIFDCFLLRLKEYASFRYINLLYYLPKSTGIFIFGYLASRNQLHNYFKEQFLKKVMISITILILAILFYFYSGKATSWIFSASSPYFFPVSMGLYELMNLLVALSYMLIILLLSSLSNNKILTNIFSYAGRMTLTNYLMQSVIYSIMMYGWGLGYFGSDRPLQFIWIPVFVFIFQAFLSYLWLKKHQHGPVEWLWRKWTYRNN